MGNKFNDNTVKYQLKLSINVDGVVAESDIVGSLFSNFEGLLEEELELKQLQKSGRIGRIDFRINSRDGKTKGMITIPSSLNKINSAILAATLETVERVGPCSCIIRLEKISDVRGEKRDQIKKRASEIMKMWNIEAESDTKAISKFVEKDTTKGKVVVFGPDKLNAGSQIFNSQNIIIVEGRADIVNLINYGIENTIALDGTKVPATIKNLSKNRNVTAFLDGDKGGDFILKELVQTTEVDFVARAPFRTEVEDLPYKKVKEALDNKIPVKKARFVTEDRTVLDFLDEGHSGKKLGRGKSRRPTSKRQEAPTDRRKEGRSSRDQKPRKNGRRESSRRGADRPRRRDGDRSRRRDSSRRRDRGRSRRKVIKVPGPVKELINQVRQTSTVLFLNDEYEMVSSVSTSEAFDELQKVDGVESIIIDGVVTQRMFDVANQKDIKLITGAVLGDIDLSKHKTPEITTFNRI